MYRIVKQNNHYIAKLKTKVGERSYQPSLIAQYNELIPDLENKFASAFLNSLSLPKKSLNKYEYSAQRKAYILDELYSAVGYDYDLAAYTELAYERQLHNIYNRIKRFKRKADLSRFNYFATFTYSDAFYTEDSFRKSLKKCFSNLHSRRGWLVMGKFERGKEGRLHFHCFIYIPDGEMVGSFFESSEYYKRSGKIETRLRNTFFEERFGRSDFEPINNKELTLGTAKEYIVKYIYKEPDEPMFYSRGIPTYIETDIDIATDKIVEFNSFVHSFIISDNSFYCDETTGAYLYYQLDRIRSHGRIRLVV